MAVKVNPYCKIVLLIFVNFTDFLSDPLNIADKEKLLQVEVGTPLCSYLYLRLALLVLSCI